MTRLIRTGASILMGLALLLGSATVVLGATDPDLFDPQGFDIGLLLTAAGVPVAAAMIAAFIQILKRFWTGLEAGNEAKLNVVLSAVLMAYAFWAIGSTVTPVSLFLLFLAWLNLAGATKVAYDVAPDGMKTALKGSDAG